MDLFTILLHKWNLEWMQEVNFCYLIVILIISLCAFPQFGASCCFCANLICQSWVWNTLISMKASCRSFCHFFFDTFGIDVSFVSLALQDSVMITSISHTSAAEYRMLRFYLCILLCENNLYSNINRFFRRYLPLSSLAEGWRDTYWWVPNAIHKISSVICKTFFCLWCSDDVVPCFWPKYAPKMPINLLSNRTGLVDRWTLPRCWFVFLFRDSVLPLFEDSYSRGRLIPLRWYVICKRYPGISERMIVASLGLQDSVMI